MVGDVGRENRGGEQGDGYTKIDHRAAPLDCVGLGEHGPKEAWLHCSLTALYCTGTSKEAGSWDSLISDEKSGPRAIRLVPFFKVSSKSRK